MLFVVFSLVVFNILSLSLTFVSLITVCLVVLILGFILPRTLCASWTWLTIFFPMLEKFSTIISSNIFSGPFSLSSSGTPIMQMLMHLMLSQRVLRLSSFFCWFIYYSLFYILICSSDFHHSVLQVIYPFLCLSYSAIDSFQSYYSSLVVCSLVLVRLW